MAFSNLQLFLLSSLLLSISSTTHGADFIFQECGQNFTNNDILSGNINTVILDLVTKTKSNGFASSTYGSNNDTVYGLAECRGDVTIEDCSACIVSAGDQLQTACPNTTESSIWFHQCHLHYSTTNFIGQPDTNKVGLWRSASKSADPIALKQGLKELFAVVVVAASSGENRKLGLGEIHESGGLNLYGMAQCTWDLEELACVQCLNAGFEVLLTRVESDGCIVILKSCVARFESSPFLVLNAGPNLNVTTSNIIVSNI